jgi:hypothetical protein
MSNHATASPPTVEIARLEPLRPMPIYEVQRAMQEYQQGLEAILADSDWQTFRDNAGNERRFVKRSGWRKIATWFGLDLLVNSGNVLVARDERGKALRATVIARVVAPNGRMAEDVAVCDASERAFSKLEHDLVATATTRALNRATADLVGMGDVSAEEMSEEVAALLPDWAQKADDAFAVEMLDHLGKMFGPDRALALSNGIETRYGYVPNVVAGLVRAIARMMDEPAQDPVGTSQASPQPAQTTESGGGV